MSIGTILSLPFTVIAGVGLCHWTLSLVYRWRARRRSAPPHPDIFPFVSVLKPLKGLDDELGENLRSFFLLSYPNFELIFGVGEESDPAIELVQRLKTEFPGVSARMVVDQNRIGPNPKVNNLVNIYPYVRGEVVVINDSNTRVKPHYLDGMISALWQPGVGLVTSPIRGVGAVTLGAALENLQLNSFVAGSIPVLQDLFAIPITIGKSMAIRRETLDRIGGFVPLGHYLAEDDQLGKAIQRLEYKVVRATQAIDNVNVTWSLGRFLKRQTRWAMMRRYTTLSHYLAEPFANPILWALFACLASPSRMSAIILAFTTFCKICIDFSFLRAHQAPRAWYTAFLIVMKDILMPGIWLVPLFVHTVSWRGHTFRIQAETEVELLGDMSSITLPSEDTLSSRV